uniref:Phytocyanin domain-containing protein n=1 Tax=Leersia perrieri TaxID=77586 RepID=A0A0D9UZS2_9ORYZ
MHRSISSTGGNLSPSHRLLIAVAAVVAIAATAVPGAAGYKNYTVGDDKGWYDGLTLPGIDYQEWADGKNFSLGDFLIFNTDKNHSVVQTRNETLYKSCDYNDSGPDDTVEWSAAAPEFSKDAVTVAVPLLKEGATYFFSGNYDGEQCQNGQQFAITVAHGQGLPPDLRPPAAEAPGPSAGAGGARSVHVRRALSEPRTTADAAPVFDFSHPKNVSTTPADKTDNDGDGDDGGGGGAPTSAGGRSLAGIGSGLVVVAATLLMVID